MNSNIPLSIHGIDKVNVIALDDYQLLPLTCRKTIWENKDKYDLFLYGENDHLFLEKHLDNHIHYSKILPKNRITGLIQIEKDKEEIYYPGYHSGKGYHFEWDFKSVEVYQGKNLLILPTCTKPLLLSLKHNCCKLGKRLIF